MGRARRTVGRGQVHCSGGMGAPGQLCRDECATLRRHTCVGRDGVGRDGWKGGRRRTSSSTGGRHASLVLVLALWLCSCFASLCLCVSSPSLLSLSSLSLLSLFLSCLGLTSSNAHLRRVGPPAMGGAARGSRGPGVSYVPPGPCPRVLRSQPWGARHEVTSALPRDVYIGPRTAR